MEAKIIPTEHPHIIKKEGVCGGSPIIKGTRIAVYDIVGFRKIGMSVEEILEYYPQLNRSQSTKNHLNFRCKFEYMEIKEWKVITRRVINARYCKVSTWLTKYQY